MGNAWEKGELKSLLVYPKEAAQLLGVKRTQFFELAKLPGFPKAKYFTPKSNPMYSRKELEQWVDSL